MVRPPNDGAHLEAPQAQTGSSSEGVRSATSGNTPCAASPAEKSIPGPTSIDDTKEAELASEQPVSAARSAGHIEERRQFQRWKDGDLRTTYIAMAETQPLKTWAKSDEDSDRKQTREGFAGHSSRTARAKNEENVSRRPLEPASDNIHRAFGCLPLAWPRNPSDEGFCRPAFCVIAG